MTIENNKIVAATEGELFDRYLKYEYDDIYSFPEYVRMIAKAGTIVEKQGII